MTNQPIPGYFTRYFICRHCGRLIRKRGVLRTWKSRSWKGYVCPPGPRLLHQPETYETGGGVND